MTLSSTHIANSAAVSSSQPSSPTFAARAAPSATAAMSRGLVA
eukprot:CAMPEP_0183410774 /NCGR_PEP_ID=MMETSP0370-20130417/19819_1 /TAXON_ID=268820 /ORGANISM="Peridinium aciculiferum, Strain PAER-2" /LENGTH=42 /DNA_ID= /DNA_START= /DNA_END= /DNA_ORIENTATION=